MIFETEAGHRLMQRNDSAFRFFAHCAAFPAIAAVAACGDAGGGRSVLTDSAGIEIVSYNGPDHLLPAELAEEFRLGGSETDPQQSFFNVSAATIGADAESNIYVFDREGGRIIAFDSRGRFLRSMGRSGEGPGEIGLGFAVIVKPDGTAGVLDVSKRGVVWFAPDGEPLPIQPTPPEYYGGTVATMGDAFIFPVQRITSDDKVSDALLRVDVRSDGADTATLVVQPPNEMKPVHFPSCGMRISGMPPIFAPTMRWAANSVHVTAALGAAYDVELYDGARLIRRTRRDREPLPATEQLAIQEIGEAMQVRVEGGVLRCEPREVARVRGFASTIPAIARVALSPDGWLWVEHGAARGDPKAIDLFTPSGSYAGTLPPGSPFPILFLPDGRIAAAETDEFDVTRLAVFRINLVD